MGLFTACSLFPELDSFHGSALDPDGSFDAPQDAPVDAGPGADTAPAKRFCETYDASVPGTLCEDMDSPDALAGWVTPEAGVSLTTDLVTSPPRSLDIVSNEPGGCVFHAESRAIAGNATALHLEMDVDMVSTRTDGLGAFYFNALWGGGTPNVSCVMILGSTLQSVPFGTSGDVLLLQSVGTTTVEVARGAGPVWTQAPSPTKFRHVVLDYDSQSPAPPSLSIDGNPGSVTLSSDAGVSCAGKHLFSVNLGLHCGANNAFHFRYDNVVIAVH